MQVKTSALAGRSRPVVRFCQTTKGEDVTTIVVLIILALIAAYAAERKKLLPKRVTVYEFERGLKYHKGRFEKILGPGQYSILPYFTSVTKIDTRLRYTTIGGQEVMTRDGVTLKASLAAEYQVADPAAAVSRVESFEQALYLELQMGLRELIGGEDVEQLLPKRGEFGKLLKEMTAEKLKGFGLELQSVNVKDIMFPGELKKIFNQVVKARQEGLAALEKARGETAALRKLANAARQVEKSPGLMPLRILQSLGEGHGQTVVLNLSPEMIKAPMGGSLPEEGEEE